MPADLRALIAARREKNSNNASGSSAAAPSNPEPVSEPSTSNAASSSCSSVDPSGDTDSGGQVLSQTEKLKRLIEQKRQRALASGHAVTETTTPVAASVSPPASSVSNNSAPRTSNSSISSRKRVNVTGSANNDSGVNRTLNTSSGTNSNEGGLPRALNATGTTNADSGRPQTQKSEGDRGSNDSNPSPSYSPSNIIDEMSNLSIIDPGDKVGKNGVPINVPVNYLKLDTLANSFFEYRITFNPNIDSEGTRKKIVRSQDDLRCVNYDGGSSMYSIRSLGTRSFTYTLPRENKMITVKIEQVRQIGNTHPQRCHLLNLMFKKLMRILKYKVEKKAAFLTSNPIQIQRHHLEIWPGYALTVATLDGGLLLTCDVSHRVIRTQNVWDAMNDIHRTVHPNEFRAEVGKQICNEVVLTRYNKKTYRIDDIDYKKNPMSTFPKEDGTEISFMEYYDTVYGLTIVDPKQPLLLHRAKKRRNPEMGEQLIYLVPELCHLTGMSEDLRKNHQILKEISEHTKPNPANRVQALRKFVDSVNNSPEASKELKNWGVSLSADPVEIQARNIMAGTCVMFAGPRGEVPVGPEADFGRELGKKQLIGRGTLSNWVIVHTQRDVRVVHDFVQQVMQCLPNVGVPVTQPPRLVQLPRSDTSADYLNALKQNLNEDVQIAVTVFSFQRQDRYDAVKKLLCQNMPVASQCIIGKTLGNPQKLRRVALNIALQMVAKMGGELWQMNIPNVFARTMFIGMDVYHQAKGKTESVVGFVASRNPGASKYFSQSFSQGTREELITNHLKNATLKALHRFREENGFFPDNVVVFRDGVGDGQIQVVKETEQVLIKESFSEINEKYTPGFTFVIVQKRISTRIFRDGGSAGIINAAPGTVVDKVITKRGFLDFYLVSQHVRQGTVTPTRYVVSENSPGFNSPKPFSIDEIQNLAFKMTFLYYNWPGSVRVPAPCQYAHKIAQLVGMNIQGAAHPNLENKLWYL